MVAVQSCEVLQVVKSSLGGVPVLVRDGADVVIERLVEEPGGDHVTEVVPVESTVVGHRLPELFGEVQATLGKVPVRRGARRVHPEAGQRPGLDYSEYPWLKPLNPMEIRPIRAFCRPEPSDP